MDVAIIPNFMSCWVMLHNLLISQEELKFENILTSLEKEWMIENENNCKDNHGCVQNRYKCRYLQLNILKVVQIIDR
jgi:hypothetical protein